jgi:hypothetical protein
MPDSPDLAPTAETGNQASAPPAVPAERWAWLSQAGLWNRVGTWALFLLLPFAMLSWLAPFVSWQTIGNDYSIFSLLAQLDLMWSIHRGTFPLYMPGFAGGHSTAAMTLGQLYHPISWISSLMPGYWEGLALEWNTFFRLLSLGFTHLVLFHVCRRLGMGRVAAFLCSFPVIYNLRMLDSFRYGAALEAYTGMVLVLSAGMLVFLEERSKGKVVFLAASTYLLVVSGHPQWALLGSTGAFLFLVLFPWVVSAIRPSLPPLTRARVRRYFKRIFVGGGAGMLLSSPYVLTFFLEFFRTNESRAANTNYDWTLAYSDSLRGELSNFLFPLHADVHGAFGGSALFLVVALLPVAALIRRPPWCLWLMYALGAFALLFSAGHETPVHRFVVAHVPLFESFRTPGRIVLWLPLAAFPILAWLLRPSSRRALFVAASGAVAIPLWVWLRPKQLLPMHEAFSPHAILAAAIPANYDSLILLLSAATALALVLAAALKRGFRYSLALAIAGTVVTSWLCLSVGTWKQNKARTYSFSNIVIDRVNSTAAHASGGEGDGMELRSVSQYRHRGVNPARPLGVVVHDAEATQSDDEVLQHLRAAATATATRVFIDGPIRNRAQEASSDKDSVALIYNTSNRFKFDVAASKDGYFVLGLPLLPGFMCRVDGLLAKVVRADALYPSVFLSTGFHTVDFFFVSWPFFVGTVLGFATLCALVPWLGRRGRRSRSLKILALACLPLGLLLLWFLYGGPSFETHYLWQVNV